MARRKTKSRAGGARPGAGRKRIYKELVYRTVGFEKSALEKLARIAKERGESFGAIVRKSVDAYLRRQKQ
jgi:hypothetical protein